MQFTEPKIEQHDEQPYVGLRTQVSMQELDSVIPQLVDQVAAWLARQRVESAGAPLVRYHVIDMDAELDITVGFPVSAAPNGDERIVADALPAGRYAALIFTGVENGIQGNAALIEWIAGQGLQMDRWDDQKGDAFGGRVEYLLDGPDDDPNPSSWRTEVAIRLVDEQSTMDKVPIG